MKRIMKLGVIILAVVMQSGFAYGQTVAGDYAMNGNKLEIQVPRSRHSVKDDLDFGIKWSDTIASAMNGQIGAGQMKIRFYTGNLSVGYFCEYWGTGSSQQYPGDVPTIDYCDKMKSVSVSSVSDYLGWCRIEPEPGKLDWSFYDNNQQILQANGLSYNVFSWLHFPPKWYMNTPDYVPYRCTEHDKPIQMTSLWAPGTLKIYDRFYKALAAHFGDKIAFIRLATPSEFGEIGYPVGYTSTLVKQEHAHEGYWCNDKYARADFSQQIEKRYKDISVLNDAWGSSFKSFGSLEYPDITKDRTKFTDPLGMSVGKRRWILDFIDWYYGSQSRFVRKAVAIVRKNFPGKEIIVSMGYGSQLTAYGNDDVGIAKLCKELKLSCQTPGNISYLCMKSLSTSCHFYKVPYITEPTNVLSRQEEINRIWTDASCGVQTYFDYPDNMLGAKDAFREYRAYLDGSKSVVETAVLFPTTDHRLRYEHQPIRTSSGVNGLREFLDYDLVDERMIHDKALSNYKLLIAYDGNIMEPSTLLALRKWISLGGILLVRDFGPIETVDGSRSLYSDLFPKIAYKGSARPSVAEIVSTCTKQIGKGYVIVIPSGENDWPEFAAEASEMAYNLSKYFPGHTDIALIDGKIDGITATLFKDRILYLNHSDKKIEKTVILRGADFSGKATGKPDRQEYKLELEPHSIVQIPLH